MKNSEFKENKKSYWGVECYTLNIWNGKCQSMCVNIISVGTLCVSCVLPAWPGPLSLKVVCLVITSHPLSPLPSPRTKSRMARQQQIWIITTHKIGFISGWKYHFSPLLSPLCYHISESSSNWWFLFIYDFLNLWCLYGYISLWLCLSDMC